jgi:hypothetical protein
VENTNLSIEYNKEEMPIVYSPITPMPHNVLADILKQLGPLKREEIARILRAAATFFDVTEDMEM